MGITPFHGNVQKSFWLLVMPLALAVQLVSLQLLPSDMVTSMDSHEYLAISEAVYKDHVYGVPAGLNGFDQFPGESPTRMRQPLYPLFLVVFYWLPGQKILVVQMVQILLNCAVLWFLIMSSHILARDMIDPLAYVLPAVYIPWLITSGMILSEALFTFLLWATIYTCAKYTIARRLRFLPISGLLLGLLILTKPVGILVFVAITLYFAFSLGSRRALAVSVISASAVVTVAPWAVRNYISVDKVAITPTVAGYNLWVASKPLGNRIWKSSPEYMAATEGGTHYYIDAVANDRFRALAMQGYSASNPLNTAWCSLLRITKAWLRCPGTGDMGRKSVRYVFLSAAHIGMIIFAVIGFLRLASTKRWLLVLPAIALTFALPVSKGLTRYILPAYPAVVLLGAHGFLSALNAATSLCTGYSGR
jgi:4-amino-4-deoxy-L-arabinose transferase-like glycosyltransferase